MNTWTLSLAFALGILFNNPDPTNALPYEQPRLSFSVLSDIHIQAWDRASQRKLKAALQDLQQVAPTSSALILNGDLTNGRKSDYDTLASILSASPHPQEVYSTIGNHEFYKAWFDASGGWNPGGFPNGETDLASKERFLQFTGEKNVYYDKIIQGYHFIFLGSEQYRQSDPSQLEDAYLSSEQLEWLRQKLKQDEGSGKPIFLFLHQPLPDTVSGTTACCVNNRAIVQHKLLKSILSVYPKVVLFTGHTHWELKSPHTLVQDTFTMVNSSSVEQPFADDGNGGEKQLGPEASEGLVVDVYDSRVVIRGRNFAGRRWIPEAQFMIPADRASDKL